MCFGKKCKVMLTEFYVYWIVWFQKAVFHKNGSILLIALLTKIQCSKKIWEFVGKMLSKCF